MIKKIAWETFKNTGDINSFMELKQIENIEKQLQENQMNNQLNPRNTIDKETDF